MPSLGPDMQFGTIVEWRVKPGDAVKGGDVVALVETEKGVIEVEIFDNGVIEFLVVQPGHKVPVGATLAIVKSDGKGVEPQTAPTPIVEKLSAEEKPPAKVAAILPTAESPRLRISPLARKRAQELCVEVESISGMGEGGCITAADIERTAATISVAPSAIQTTPPLAKVL
ncbi:MAG: putative pyruvate dehydrogenase, E2 component, dihydrolipoamide acetyltransferase, partial [Deltaproteobacteria bacterium]|nr:putative pyruvate dehydrogenase, E2 component, dihydrolipoamide acetyltransferase [Deltaproteobacteria bacterium]